MQSDNELDDKISVPSSDVKDEEWYSAERHEGVTQNIYVENLNVQYGNDDSVEDKESIPLEEPVDSKNRVKREIKDMRVVD